MTTNRRVFLSHSALTATELSAAGRLTRAKAYVPARSAENVKQMLANNSVLALVSQIGTPNTGAVPPIIEKAGVPLVDPITGSGVLCNVFHIRPSYGYELTRTVDRLVKVGLTVDYSDLLRLGKDKALGLTEASIFRGFKSKRFAPIRSYYANLDAIRFKVPAGSADKSWINAKVLNELASKFSTAASYVGALPMKLRVIGSDLTFRV